MKALCLGALAAASLAAQAQTPPPDPAQADAQVPAPAYSSSLRRMPRGMDNNDTTDWKKANEEVGQFRRGHPDLLKWESGQRPAASAPAHRH